MALDLGTAVEQANRLAQGDPWGWLIYLESTNPDSGAKEALRLTTFNQAVTFGSDEVLGALTWSPAPITVGTVRDQSDGSLPKVQITVANVRSELMGLLFDREWLEGERAELILVNLATIDDPEAALRLPTEIDEVAADERVVSVTLSSDQLYEVTAPLVDVTEDGCRHAYGGEVCQFPIDELDPGQAILGPCLKRVVDCRARRDLAVAEGYTPILWPRRFGAYPGASA